MSTAIGGKLQEINEKLNNPQQPKLSRQQRRRMEREYQREQRKYQKKQQKTLMERHMFDSQVNPQAMWLCCPDCGSGDLHDIGNDNYRCDKCGSVHHITQMGTSFTEPDH